MASHVRQNLSVKLAKGIQAMCFLSIILFALHGKCVVLHYQLKSIEEPVQPQWPKLNAIHPYRLICTLTVLLLSFQQRLCHMKLLDSDETVLVNGLYGGVLRGSMPCYSVWCRNTSKEKNNLRQTCSTRVFQVCNSRIIQSCLEIREATEIRKCSGFGLQSPILLSFPFLSDSIYRTIQPTLTVCILYLPLIQSLPLMENIVQLLGWGWCSVFGIARVPAVVRCCPSAVSILSTLFLLFFSIYVICCFLDDVAITSICTYITYNKHKQILIPCVYALCPIHPLYKLENIDLFICFSLEEPIHLYHLDSHWTRDCRVVLSDPNGPYLHATNDFCTSYLDIAIAVFKT